MSGRDRGQTWRRGRLLAAGYDWAVHCEPLAHSGRLSPVHHRSPGKGRGRGPGTRSR